jgi:Phosphotransferase enzyme family
MIPEEKKAPVARALCKAFGTTPIDDICGITRGLSSDLAFRVVLQGFSYLLRIMTRMDETNDPVRVSTCMKAAAETRLAPRVRYASAEDGVAIIDWIETAPFTCRGVCSDSRDAPRALHALTPPPKTFNYVTAHKFFIWRLNNAGLLCEQETQAVFCRYAQLCLTYPRVEIDMVSCHMDLKPENVLYDGRQVWLIDWMAAHRNDRYSDLAMVAKFVIPGDMGDQTYLEQYFGHPADEYQLARCSARVLFGSTASET